MLLLTLLLVCSNSIRAQEVTPSDEPAVETQLEPDTIGDTRHWFKLNVIARTYGDRVYIRWAPDEYVPWKFLNGYGYLVQRVIVGKIRFLHLLVNLCEQTTEKISRSCY